MKKILLVLLALVICAVLAALFIRSPKGESRVSDTSQFDIAIFVPLTGPAATGGIATKEGFELAEDAIKEAGSLVHLTYIDTKSDPKTAVAEFQKSMAGKNPNAVILELTSVTLAIRPLLKGQTFAVATAVAAPEIADPDSNLVRVFPSSRGVAEIAAKAASARQLRTCVIAHVNDDYGSESARVFGAAFGAIGGKITSTESFGLLERDFRSQAAKIIATEPDAVWVTGYGPGYLTALNQLRETGYKGTIITDWSITAPDYFSAVKNRENLLIITPVVSDFLNDAYVKKFGKAGFMVNVAFAYDSLILLHKALETSAASPAETTKAFLAISEYTGASGPIKIEPDGDIKAAFGVFTVTNNQLTPVDASPHDSP